MKQWNELSAHEQQSTDMLRYLSDQGMHDAWEIGLVLDTYDKEIIKRASINRKVKAELDKRRNNEQNRD